MSSCILIAGDEPNIPVPLECPTKREGYALQLACDGQEALDRLPRLRPAPLLDVLIVLMPRRNGSEVCQAPRADEAPRHTRVPMLSAVGRDADIAKGPGVGAGAYMTRPSATQAPADKVHATPAAPAPHA